MGGLGVAGCRPQADLAVAIQRGTRVVVAGPGRIAAELELDSHNRV